MTEWRQSLVRQNYESSASIVMIHGFQGHEEATWKKFSNLLKKESRLRDWDIISFGYESNLAPDLAGIWTGDPSIQTIADSLGTYANIVLSRYQALVLLGHSMGGLVIQRALLDHTALTSRVDKVLHFGTPSFGLKKAIPFKLPVLRKIKRQARDMTQNGKFISRLRKHWKQHYDDSVPFHFLAVAGAEDEFVPRSASIDGFPDHQCAVVPGNHLGIVRPNGPNDASLRLTKRFILGDAMPLGPWGSAALAIERREFQKVVAQLGPNRDQLDQRARINLALALDALSRREEAIEILESAEWLNTDAIGVLAGRHKRNWLQSRIAHEAETAIDLYSAGLKEARRLGNPTQAYYHEINCAFFDLVYSENFKDSQKHANEALGFCAQATLTEKPDQRLWRLATEGEAHLILEQPEESVACYEKFLSGPPKPQPWQIASASQQAFHIADVLGDEEIAQAMIDLFVGNRGVQAS